MRRKEIENEHVGSDLIRGCCGIRQVVKIRSSSSGGGSLWVFVTNFRSVMVWISGSSDGPCLLAEHSLEILDVCSILDVNKVCYFE